jgi:hypothetical protein
MMAAGGTSELEKLIAEWLSGGSLSTLAGSYVGFCEVASKTQSYATIKELKGTTGYKERKTASGLNLVVKEQAGSLGEAGKGAKLYNESAAAVVFNAVPGTVTNPKVNYAFLSDKAAFETGKILFMVALTSGVEILSTTTGFSFGVGELAFEVI